MIPGLDYLIKWQMGNMPGSTASLQKQQVLDAAVAAWVAGGRPAQTMNGKLMTYLLGQWGTPDPGVVRLISSGQPGQCYPTTAPLPTAAHLISGASPIALASPLSPWPVADWVVAAGGELMSWTGSGWVIKP